MKAVLILYEGRELPFALQGEIAALLSRIGVAGNTVHISKATDAEVEEFVAKEMIPLGAVNVKTDISSTIKASVDYVVSRYSDLINGDPVKLAVQIASDIHAGGTVEKEHEAEVLRSCIITIANCSPTTQRRYRLNKDLLSTISLIYNNHLKM